MSRMLRYCRGARMSKILGGTSLFGEHTMPPSPIWICLIYLPKFGSTQSPRSLDVPAPLYLGPPTGFYCLNGAEPEEGLKIWGPCIRDTPLPSFDGTSFASNSAKTIGKGGKFAPPPLPPLPSALRWDAWIGMLLLRPTAVSTTSVELCVASHIVKISNDLFTI